MTGVQTCALPISGSVAEALDLLATLPLASSRSLTLCDPGAIACVEILDNQLRVTAAGQPGQSPSTHTNHFLHPDFAPRDELNIFARNSSLRRLRACDEGLAELTAGPAGADVEEHFALLSRRAVCVADTGDIRRERTVASVVMLPERGELHVRPGDPNGATTQTFKVPRP